MLHAVLPHCPAKGLAPPPPVNHNKMKQLPLPLLPTLVFLLQSQRVDGKPVDPWLKDGYKEHVMRKRSGATYEVRGTTTHTQRTTPRTMRLTMGG